MGTKRLLALPLAVVLLGGLAGGQTAIQGDLSGNLGPGTYIVTGDCRILPGTTLRIAAGTTFLFGGHYTWTVEGALLAQGEKWKPILFTRALPQEKYLWGGIRFHGPGADGSVLDFCIIEHAYRRSEPFAPDCHGGGIYSGGAAPLIRDCVIRFCEAVEGGGICADAGSGMVIDRCAISSNKALRGAGAVITDSPDVLVTSSLIYANASDGI